MKNRDQVGHHFLSLSLLDKIRQNTNCEDQALLDEVDFVLQEDPEFPDWLKRTREGEGAS